MQIRDLIKSALVSLLVLLVASCSSSPEKAAESSVSSKVPTTKSTQSKPTAWQQAYQEPQETSPNAPRKTVEKSPSSEPITDVWDRIRDGFVISDYQQLHPDSERHLRWFVDHPEYVARVVERARPYLHHIVEEVQKRDMPMEIVLLPVVESGFKPYAYSKSHAAGLWQFIPGTGKVYGLQQNWWYDGRRDVIQSTRAALDYLEKLHNDFGDWQLALAAYNCGEGTVGRAIKRNQAKGKATDFWSLDLPSETSAYVPKLMAVSHMVKYPERYDLSLSPVDNKPYLTTVNIGSQIDLAKAATMAGLSKDELFILNPAFNRWATAPEGPHVLVLPLTKAEQFKRALAEMPAQNRVKWARHKIQRGESLSVIASHYATTVSVIKKANNLQSNNIRAGSHLLIPASPAQSATLAANEATKSSNDSAQKKTYTVKAGDTWWDIARKYDTDVPTLTQWNKQSNHAVLQPGQTLVIWTNDVQRKSVNYTIRDGDSLWGISRKFNVSVAQVREWNGLSDRTLLQPGQNLTLYLDET
ncbi:lytic transglycosylase [Methylophaga thiooxydans]|uniref:LysM domain protein n=1 Tax=Methylophaga thiooxydans DMS010 TaxID=637616 RepID=C0N5S8_9GAMM|nr:LysM peptidoglycan-binding domain-containing protein [Methylophaga thiooxydans]EEF79924.1 LysM domain protein [Methylophaga thiooxydans DMS010]